MDIDHIFGKISSGLEIQSTKDDYLRYPEKYLQLFGYPWYKQIEMSESVRDYKITTVRSSNGTGKTWTAAAIVLWWLDVYGPNCKVITTAKNFTSVQFMLWTRIRHQYTFVRDRFGNSVINQTNFQPSPTLHPDWFAIGYNPKIEGSLLDPESEATAFQGHHSAHTLFVIDEAMTTHPSIFRAIEGSLLDEGSRLLAIFNPTNNTGEVVGYEKDNRTNSIVISAQDLFDSPEYKKHPEHYTELVTPDACQKLIDSFGRNSPIVQARIFAEYPDQDQHAAISLGALQKARDTEIKIKKKVKVVYSWDVAGEGSDQNVVGKLISGLIEKDKEDIGLNYSIVARWNKTDHKDSMLKVYELIKSDMEDDPGIDYYLVVDAVGEGSHVPSFMQEWLPDLNVVSFKGGEKARRIDERKEMDIFNKISEAWYMSHLLIEEKIPTWAKIAMKIDQQTEHELTSRKYELRVKASMPQVWAIEKKDEWKLRNRGKSPDNADAFVMAVHCHFRSISLKMIII